MAEQEATTGEMAKSKSWRKTDDPAALSHSAARSLRHARKMYQGNKWKSTDEAAYHLQEAQILAIMDLAQAVRETRGRSG